MYRLEWKETVWSQGGVSRWDVSSSFDPLYKGSLKKCVCMAVIQISFYVSRMIGCTLHSFVVALSCFDKQLMPAVRWQRQLCWNHADATTCNQQLCLFRRLPHTWGLLWWESFVWSLESCHCLACHILSSLSVWLQTRLTWNITNKSQIGAIK